MIRLSVLYPKTEGAKFDHDYYRDKHVPLAVSTWGVERVEIDKGLNGPYEAAVHFFFPSTDAIGEAMGAEGTGAIMADVANYTDIQPVLQTSEIVECDAGRRWNKAAVRGDDEGTAFEALARSRECVRVGELAAEIEAGEEAENLADGCAFRRSERGCGGKHRDGLEQQARPLAVEASRREQEHARGWRPGHQGRFEVPAPRGWCDILSGTAGWGRTSDLRIHNPAL